MAEKQAAEYIKRIAAGEFPGFEITISYSEPKSAESEGYSLLMVKKYLRNLCRASY